MLRYRRGLWIRTPEGYTLLNTKETAAEAEELCINRFDFAVGTDMLSLKVHILYTLSDGSIILGWSNQGLDIWQADLFDGLEAGGPLPELAVEVNTIEANYGADDEPVNYVGYHLAYTEKQGNFYEWGIYLPDSQLPGGTVSSYKVLARANLDGLTDARLSIGPGIDIESSEDFELFVRGAMAELSDDGTCPEGITYEYVLELAEQIWDLSY